MVAVTVRDVTLRDGLQDEAVVPTATKLAVFESLLAAGITELEVGSFVRADRVPAMADSEALCAATAGAAVTRSRSLTLERLMIDTTADEWSDSTAPSSASTSLGRPRAAAPAARLRLVRRWLARRSCRVQLRPGRCPRPDHSRPHYATAGVHCDHARSARANDTGRSRKLIWQGEQTGRPLENGRA